MDRSVEAWAADIRAASRLGDHLKAFDLAAQALVAFPDNLKLHYDAILELARSGATTQATVRLQALAASGRLKELDDARLMRDFATLEGRLLKDLAFQSHGVRREALARHAAAAYQRAFDQAPDFYPAINAATLWRFGGEAARAQRMAEIALDLVRRAPVDYWSAATAAEALVLLGDADGARDGLREAAALASDRFDEVATTRKQLRRLVEEAGLPHDLIDALPVAGVLHWVSEDADAAFDEPGVAAALASRRWAAFGSPLTTADVWLARRLVEAGHAVHLVLPSPKDAFLRHFADQFGQPAATELSGVLASVAGLTVVTGESIPADATALRLCLRQAHGIALLRAQALDAEPLLLRLGRDGARLGRFDSVDLDAIAGRDASASVRLERALIFGDVKGFSTLREAHLPIFLDRLIGGFADVLGSFGARVEYTETAGDGLYAVMSNVAAAAECCCRLQAVVTPERLADAGLPTTLALRVGAHVGPVYRGLDRVINRQKFFGTEVIRTARIEPVTPEGEIYVTEQFAAMLYGVTDSGFVCEYVGVQPMAKGFGSCRMYSLRRPHAE